MKFKDVLKITHGWFIEIGKILKKRRILSMKAWNRKYCVVNEFSNRLYIHFIKVFIVKKLEFRSGPNALNDWINTGMQ